MKTLSLTALALVALAFAACQSSPVAQSSTPTPTQQISLTGTQSHQTVEVPVSSNTQAPYALQGRATAPTFAPGETGYNAR